jgi:hypothetical protein
MAERVSVDRVNDHFICESESSSGPCPLPFMCAAPPRDPPKSHTRLPPPHSPPAVSIESTGALPARDIFREAVKLFADKAKSVLQAMGEGGAGAGAEEGAGAAGAAPGLPVMSAAKAERAKEAVMRSSNEEEDL